MKKLISLFLAAVMVISSSPVAMAVWCNTCDESMIKCYKDKCAMCKGQDSMNWQCKLHPGPYEEDYVSGQITLISQDVNRIRIDDAIEIFKYLADMDSVIKKRDDSLRASLITIESRFAYKPSIADALEILKYLAGMNSELGLRYGG